MSLVDLAEVPRLLDPQLSPDGRTVVYMLNRASWAANRPVGHLWRQTIDGGSATQLTFGESGELFPRWSPDGASILFLANRPGDTGLQLYVLPAEGGEARALGRHPTSVSAQPPPVWAPDGSAVYFVAPDPPTAEQRERTRLRDDVFIFEGNFTQRHLWKMPVPAGPAGAATKLTDGGFSVQSFRLSHDGRRLVVHRAPTPLPDDAVRSEVWLMDADGANLRAITSNGVEEIDADLSPDQSRLLFLAEANERLEPYHTATLFLVPAEGGTPRKLLSDFPHAIERAAWAPDGRSAFVVANMGVHSEIFRIDVAAARAEPLTDGRHSIQFWSIAPRAGRMIFQLDEPTRLGDAWTLPLEGGALSRVTGIYDSLGREFQLPRQEKVTWKGADGVTVEGLLFFPVGYVPGQRSPLIVQLHGGPHESDKFGYGPYFLMHYVPVLTARGYAVLRPNYRGSAGYGDAFLRDVVGGYFNQMHTDVLAGVDRLVAQGIADPDRLAVMGVSAGGHLTNKLVTVTDRFKAASSTAGASNWISLFAQTDLRAGREAWFGGTPWQTGAPIEALWNGSPLKDVAKVRTPTLFVVGENDPRVPMMQAVEMYRGLRANGVTTRLLVAPREGHQWGELRHQLYKANAELEWFERHVVGRSYRWERAPGDPSDGGGK
jgi:dipeptidyl aminopeptidase/acylaminoacyl peptidase